MPPGRGARLQVVGVQQLGRCDPHGIDVGVVLVQVGKGQFHGLDAGVHRFQAVHRVLAHAMGFEHAQRHQRRDALAVGRDFVDDGVAKRLAHGAHPVGAVFGQVGFGHGATIGLAVRRHGAGQFTPVKRFAFGLCDQLQRAGMGFAAEHFAGLGRAAVGHETLGKPGLGAQFVGPQGPQAGDGGRHREAVACVVDGGLGQLGKRQLAKAFGQSHPGRHGAGHGDRVPAGFGDAAALREVVGRPSRGRAARGVETMQFLAVPEDGKPVAADAATGGLDHRQRHGGGQRGVHRVAASQQHAQAGLCGQRMRGGNHVAAQHRAALRGVGQGPIGGGGVLGHVTAPKFCAGGSRWPSGCCRPAPWRQTWPGCWARPGPRQVWPGWLSLRGFARLW